jgi:ABC-type nitrate/sulfonate/bicarbonate transport system permease component
MTPRRRALIFEAIVPIVAVMVWWQVSKESANPYFPPLSEIMTAFRHNWLFERFGSDVLPSLFRLASGFAIAVILGIGGGIVLGMNQTLRRMMDPIVEFMRAIPAPAMIPFGIIVLGVGDLMKIAIIVLVCLSPILLTTIDGVRGVEPRILDSAAVYQLPTSDRLFRIILPSASPQIFSGLRSSISLALVVMVISEMIASTNGIGFFVLQSQRTFDLPDMWSGVLLIGILGYLLNLVLVLMEHYMLRWHRGARRASD